MIDRRTSGYRLPVPSHSAVHHLVAERISALCAIGQAESRMSSPRSLLVNRLQQHDDRPLQDLVLQRGEFLVGGSSVVEPPLEYARAAREMRGTFRISRDRAVAAGCPPGPVRILPRHSVHAHRARPCGCAGTLPSAIPGPADRPAT